jgi:hypothetical protein
VRSNEKPRSWVAPALALVLVLLPWLAFARGQISERRHARAQTERLERVPFLINVDDLASCNAVAAREGVVIARLDMGGATLLRTTSTSLDRADAQLPPWPARVEVRAALAGNRTFGRHVPPNGSTVVLTLAQPRPEGGALYLLTGVERSWLGQVGAPLLVGYTLAILLALVLVAMARRRRSA